MDGLRRSGRAGDLASIYLHIPFCRNFCLFCPIYKTGVPDETGLADYVDHLVREMRVYAKLQYVRKLRFGAIYVGGGSPSLLSPSLLSTLLTAVRDHFPLVEGCEISVEGEVRTLNDPDRLEALRAHGCTRISFGVQSFDPFVRLKSNLRPRQEEIETCVKGLRGAGFDVNMDLMFGLPGQTLAVWQADLARAVQMGADQLDCYDTVLYPNTKLFRLRHKYKALLADDVEKTAMFSYALDFCPSVGLEQRTNAIFSRDGVRFKLPSLFSGEGIYEIVALGDSAIGYLNGTAYRNISPLDRYMAWSGSPELPVRLIHALTPEERCTKRMLSFCRMLHVAKAELTPELLAFVRPILDDLIARGVVEEDAEELRLTRQGRLWYDNVFLSFIPRKQRAKMWKIMY
jgi:oxygen-independent coproporphyrinogen-3 oxidase